MGKSAPKPPDPYKVAQAQTGSNIETAKAQQQLSMTGQVNPMGSVQYVTDPNSPSGFRQVTEFSPEMQALLHQGQDLQAQFGNVRGAQMGRVDDHLASGPFSMDAGRGAVLSDINRTMMDPLWERRQDQLQTQLANEGIQQGSDAYAERMRQFGQQSDDAYNKMFLDSYGLGNDAAMKEWLMPMQALGMVTSAGNGGQMPSLPQFGQTSQPGVAPTDLASLVTNNYNQQVSQANASMGGLYGLGAAGLGGWAQAGFPGASAALALISQRDMKTDIERIGDDPRGWGIYRFRYKSGGPWMEGFMVDEVEPIRPDAIVVFPSGVKGIRYDLLAH